MPKARLKAILANVLLAVAALGVSGVSLELVLRGFLGDRYAERPRIYERNAELGWSPAANLHHEFNGGDYAVRVATDASGRRLGKLGAAAQDDPVLFVSGDSYAFGWGVNTDQTFASHLDEMLAAPEGVRVVNLGVGGYGTLQSALRLKQAAALWLPERVRGIVILHSHNDPADNVRFLMLQAGLLRHGRDRRVNFSASHAVNLFSQAIEIATAMGRESGAGGEPAVGAQRRFSRAERDVQFSFHLNRVARGPVDIAIPGRITVHSGGITAWERDAVATMRKRRLSPLQEAALTESIEQVHCAVPGRSIPVIHVVLHSAPRWYQRAVENAARRADACGNRVVFAGAVPVKGVFQGPVMNAHSGGHFTPELNRHYAERIAGWFREANGASGRN